jgi:antibiotic biosynthesis monooxygenase (ABM) superfamily enzyme
MSDVVLMTDWDLVILALYPTYFASLVLLVPFLSILSRAGRPVGWILLLLVPLVGWAIVPWIVAFMHWKGPAQAAGETFH